MAKLLGISNAAAILACDAIVDLLDSGGAGTLKIYDGTQPPNGPDEAVTTQNVLAELPLSNPAFGDAADNDPGAIAIASAITSDLSANNTGTATWFRAFNGSGNAVIDGSVGTSDADLVMDSVNITAGQTIKVNSWTFEVEEQL